MKTEHRIERTVVKVRGKATPAWHVGLQVEGRAWKWEILLKAKNKADAEKLAPEALKRLAVAFAEEFQRVADSFAAQAQEMLKWTIPPEQP